MFLQRYKKQNEEIQISILNSFFLFICTVSIFNIILLTIGSFYPLISVFGSIILLSFLFFIFKIKIVNRKEISLLLLLVIFLALFLRLSPNLYLTGGQDQGSYVSLSKQYEVNHSLYIEDKLRKELPDGAKILYDKSGAATMLGVSPINLGESTFYMPFYPVFPSWMSVFGALFGSDNRIYAITMFSILSIIGTYLLAYEVSGRKKTVGLLSSFLLAINPLHVYFSNIPLTEIVSLSFFLFSFYFLAKFFNDYKDKKEKKLTLGLSLFAAVVLFFTRMNGLFYLPVIIVIPVIVFLFSKDRKLTKYIAIYSVVWISFILVSYLFYYIFLPDLFSTIFEGRILGIFNSSIIFCLAISSLIILIVSLRTKRIQNILKNIFIFINKYIFLIFITIFVGLILYELYFYIKEVFIESRYTLFSFESLSYIKQLNFLASFLYLSPIGFLILPVGVYYLRKKIEIKILIFFILIFLVYCWGIIRLSPYHYYFIRYQLSELIPLCIIFISVFLSTLAIKKNGKAILIVLVVLSTLYYGFFSVIQLKGYEGANPAVFEELQTIIKEEDLLLVAENQFVSSQQIVFPMKYYYGINTFTIYTSTYIDYEEIQQLKNNYENVYILMTNPNFEQKSIKFVKEIDFKHNYFVHCLRDKDTYFKMEGHSPDLPFCEYMIIPNRYYYGTYRMFLYLWE